MHSRSKPAEPGHPATVGRLALSKFVPVAVPAMRQSIPL